MNNNNLEHSNSAEQVETGEHLFAHWMTVQEAVAYCVSKGLPRTAKTVRKWAQRSIEAVEGGGEIAVQRQDTENGFRWLIRRDSLDVKIAQEKELIVRIGEEHVGVNTSKQVLTGMHLSERVGTDANVSTKELINEQAIELNGSPEQVNTRPQSISKEIVSLLKKQLERAERQLDVKDKQIDALLERDRETNILIQGLQTSLTGVVNALPSGRREESHFPPQKLEQGTATRSV